MPDAATTRFEARMLHPTCYMLWKALTPMQTKTSVNGVGHASVLSSSKPLEACVISWHSFWLVGNHRLPNGCHWRRMYIYGSAATPPICPALQLERPRVGACRRWQRKRTTRPRLVVRCRAQLHFLPKGQHQGAATCRGRRGRAPARQNSCSTHPSLQSTTGRNRGS